MAPQNDNDGETGAGIEDLLNTLIVALQGLKTRTEVPHESGAAGLSPSPVRSTMPLLPDESHGRHRRAPALAPEETVSRKEGPWMGRLATSKGNGGWTRYSDYHLENQSTEETAEDEPAVLLDLNGEIKTITIESPHLIRALSKVSERPSLRKQPQTTTLYEPFLLLFDHLEDVRNEIGRLDNSEAQADLKALEFAVKEAKVAPRWSAARAENMDSSLVRFDTLWRLFRPGDLVVHTDDLGNEWLLTLTHVEERRTRSYGNLTSKLTTSRYLEFWTCGLTWNGHENKLERYPAAFRIDEFVGSREIHLLSLYPVRYQRAHDSVDKFLQSLAARGRDWFKLVSSQTCCLNYDGPAFSGKTLFDARRREDPEASAMPVNEARVVISRESKKLGTSGLSQLSPFQNVERGDEERLIFAEIDAREAYVRDNLHAIEVLTDEQARFCLPLVGCYAVENKEFYLISVERLRPVVWEVDPMERLVLDREKKTLLEGLVSQHYSKEQGGHQRDFIPKKGEGLVVLLHGPPGVGKTLTAESLAQHVKKPLISLSVGNLIWDESKLQERLVSEFSRAIDWDAVLLLDEADVVLEERSFEDVRRNAIVSVFLRELEYYSGVLFLTTNRISTMDVAFQSRIQIGIGFKDLTPADRKKIWLNLINLNKDNHKDRRALEQIRENADKLAKWELNGREIRNVLNIADACARRRPTTGWVTYDDIEKAARATLEFKDMLETERSNLKTEQTVWTPYSRGLI